MYVNNHHINYVRSKKAVFVPKTIIMHSHAQDR